MGFMEVEAQVGLHFGSCEGVQQRYPVGYPWSRHCCWGLAVGIERWGKGWGWILVDLGIISAELTPMTISGTVLGSQPSPQQVLALSLMFGASQDPCSGCTALAMAGRREFLQELSASLQIPQRGVKCSYFQLQGTDIYSCPDATANP